MERFGHVISPGKSFRVSCFTRVVVSAARVAGRAVGAGRAMRALGVVPVGWLGMIAPPAAQGTTCGSQNYKMLTHLTRQTCCSAEIDVSWSILLLFA